MHLSHLKLCVGLREAHETPQYCGMGTQIVWVWCCCVTGVPLL